MKKFTMLTSRVAVLARNDIDTDQIIPARFLTATEKTGLGRHLFAGWRYDAAGAPVAEFPLNRPEAAGAAVLLAGRNFGCGSSREHAPWALMDHGFRAVIAPSFADIFRNNAHQNGLLPVILGADAHDALRDALAADPAAEVSIDLAAQALTLPGGARVEFPIDGFAKLCLLEGADELDFIRRHEPQIARHEAGPARGERP